MRHIISVACVAFTIQVTVCLNALNGDTYQANDSPLGLKEIVEYLTNPRYRKSSFAQARELMKELNYLKTQTRSAPTPKPHRMNREKAMLIESELRQALNQRESALLERPYVEKRGRNDFLVIQPGSVDPMVTIVPNSIYYDIEKKCVNWLDDCSLQGIRSRLLSGVKSP